MKITAFNPLILTSHAEETVALLEELGFKQAHHKTGINGRVNSFDLKYGEDFRADVAQTDAFPQDMTAIRMNVRDFDEAYDFLISKGFKNVQGDKTTDTGSSKATLMISPTGFAISLAEHIRKD
jgi:hypothetical protein